jgi:UDP-sulfoquinovose synthase
MHLDPKKYDVLGIDNNLREKNVQSIGSETVMPKDRMLSKCIDIAKDPHGLKLQIRHFQPDAIIHLAEQPSAPFSMKSQKHATDTMSNNVIGTLNLLHSIKEECPTAHLIKIGTEGEYPDWLWNGKHIPEGGRMKVDITGTIHTNWEIPTPRYAGSWYHWSKVHDSMNIDYACRIWNLRATDINQGIVYGHMNGTRLDYDQYFGTAINRFVVQAVAGMPLTVYGKGNQTRGFIALQNSVEALELLINNPAKQGELRVIHQTTDAKTVNEVAELVQKVTGCEIEHIPDPRTEAEECKFTFDTSTLDGLGLQKIEMEEVIRDLVQKVSSQKHRIRPNVIKPTTTWK